VSDDDPELTLLGEPQLTAADVAERAGLPLEKARRLWRTLGFPERGDARAYTDADADALRLMVDLLGEGIIDFDIALNVARGVGLSMSRLADWEVGELVHHVDEAFVEQGGSEDDDASDWVMRRFGSRFEELLIYAWRRHLSAAVTRMQSGGGAGARTPTTPRAGGSAASSSRSSRPAAVT
jgi:adenylate cyclase